MAEDEDDKFQFDGEIIKKESKFYADLYQNGPYKQNLEFSQNSDAPRNNKKQAKSLS